MRKTLLFMALIIAAALFVVSTANVSDAATLYRWVDDQGVVLYRKSVTYVDVVLGSKGAVEHNFPALPDIPPFRYFRRASKAF